MNKTIDNVTIYVNGIPLFELKDASIELTIDEYSETAIKRMPDGTLNQVVVLKYRGDSIANIKGKVEPITLVSPTNIPYSVRINKKGGDLNEKM